MQQLLGVNLNDAIGAILNAIVKELFNQHHPPHVRMILISADNTIELHKLTYMADK